MRTVAGLRPGALNSVGGDLVLTNMRVVFTPLDVRDLSVVLKWGLGKAGGGRVANPLIDYAAGAVGDPVNVAGGLAGLAAVQIGSSAKVLKPPTLLLLGADGTVTEIGILQSRMSANANSANNVVRDQMVAAIQSQLA